MKPYLNVRWEHETYCTDILGGRVPDRGDDRLFSDVAFLGCSQTFAAGLPWGQTFAGLYGSRTGRRVANLGVPGYGTTSVLRQTEVDSWYADCVVILHQFDHLDRAVAQYSPTQSYPAISVPRVQMNKSDIWLVDPDDNTEAFERAEEFRQYVKGERDIANDAKWKSRKFMGELVFNLSRRPCREPERVCRFLYAKIRDTTGDRLRVFYLPNYLGKGSPFEPAPSWMADAVGAPFVDLYDTIKDLGDLTIGPTDAHLNAKAHAEIADVMVKTLG